MPKGGEHFALDWIKGELEETLDQARHALESYAESGDEDAGRMRLCLTQLHQVHGTLVMLGLEGVSLLADEMEQLAQALLNKVAERPVIAQQALMQGILRLPAYLEGIQHGAPDKRAAVLPFANEMREARGEEPLEGAEEDDDSPFAPPGEDALKRFDEIGGLDKARKIRAAYQQVLLSVLRGQASDQAIANLKKVALGLARICEGTPYAILWQALDAFVQSLGLAEVDAAAVRLLRRVDSEIRTLAQDGAQSLKRPVPLDLVGDLVAGARARKFESDELDSIANALDGSSQVGGYSISGREAMQTAAEALREELREVQDQLDLFVRSDEKTGARFGDFAEALRRTSSTLAVLGFESSQAMIAEQVQRIEAVINDPVVDDQLLMDLAGVLIQVDANLAGITENRSGLSGTDFETDGLATDAQRVVVAEARSGLEQVKQAVVDYMTAGRDWTQLADLPRIINEVKGALSMVSLTRAAEMLERAGRHVKESLLAGVTQDAQQIDAFADAISGVDYYLERMSDHSVAQTDEILDIVDVALDKLDVDGPPPAESQTEAPAAAPAVPEQAAEQISAETPSEEIVEQAPAEMPAEQSTERTAPETADGDESADAPFELEFEAEIDKADAATSVQDAEALEPIPAEPPEPIPAAAEAQSVPNIARAEAKPRKDDRDDEIVEIFVEEISEICETVVGCLPRWKEDLANEETLTEIRRAFHTLKGSGRIVGADVIGELAWSVENMLNRVIDETLAPHPQSAALVQKVIDLLPALRDAFEAGTEPDMDAVSELMEQADIFSSGGFAGEDDAPSTPPTVEIAAGVVADATADATAQRSEQRVSEVQAHNDVFDLFDAEAEEHISTLEHTLESGGAERVDEALMRAVHTLRSSASIAGFESVGAIVRPLYELVAAVRAADAALSGELFDCFRECVNALRKTVVELRSGQSPQDDLSRFEAETQRLVAGLTASEDGDKRQLVIAESLMTADAFLSKWFSGALDPVASSALRHGLVEVMQSAKQRNLTELLTLGESLLAAHQLLRDETLTEHAFNVLRESHEELLGVVNAIMADADIGDVGDAVEALATLGPDETLPMSDVEVVESAEKADLTESGAGEVVEMLEDAEDEADGSATEDEIQAQPTASEPQPAAPVTLPDDVDVEIMGIFFEEGDEILETLDQNVQEWFEERDNTVYRENMLRALHTLKGGARLAGLMDLGDQAHAFESFLIGGQEEGGLNDEMAQLLQNKYDELEHAVLSYKAAAGLGSAPEPMTPMPTAGQPSVDSDTSEEAAAETTGTAQMPQPSAGDKVSAKASAKASKKASKKVSAKGSGEAQADNVVPLPQEQVAKKAQADKAAASRTPQEMVRVSATLLEELVNLAGETSIVRGRVEQGMTDFQTSLEEMETTIERVREQLRRLEIETEAQVLFRHENTDGPSYQEFDPLEMDRYSQLQQVARALSESASDMLELKEALTYKARESETLLIQQARLNTELQEGLMRTRMVPFSRMLPRLRRIVRQIAREVDKQVEFHAYNAEGELDRTVLERMVPPLEHMLRNSVDHGIESKDVRLKTDKPRIGRIELKLSRDAGDVVIEISDDGAGIDAAAVRRKAIERGLLDADAEISDEGLLEFVLAPGFSTAAAVTQISGRGVGMDVVQSEVKQLGGRIEIASVHGKGTQFTIRLPFTVSVNRALMVSVADDVYAIPLNTIEGIVLVSDNELRELYQPEGPAFEYAGMSYRVRYLGAYLGKPYEPNPELTSVPMVLLRAGDNAVAVHVDGVQGSREIVVKSLGSQFAGVSGISGATILGDGSVVVILDLLSLVRTQGHGDKSAAQLGNAIERARCVMVVDDSVTVRKVTSRLLERQGMEVIVAKDGVEAIALLQERRPDIMLLDIEMPRMDGFEVARQVRHDDRLSTLPIVMISSRTGEKHKEHAAEIGVNRFLGKPFQESELLATIDELVNAEG